MTSFSVIVPTYNRSEELRRALVSLLAQTYTGFEVVVVDDGSEKDAAEAVRALEDPRFRYVLQPHGGVSRARNLGISLANGTYITFLDSDDEVSPEWLSSFANVFTRRDCAIVCCGIEWAAERGNVDLPTDMGPFFDHQIGLFLAGSFAVRRELFDTSGKYADGLAFSENYELALRLVGACKRNGWRIESLPEKLVVVHRRKGRTSAYNRAKLEGAEYVLREHRERFESHPDLRANFLAVAGVNAARLGWYRRARDLFRQAIKSQPMDVKNYGRLAVGFLPPVARAVWPNGNTTKEVRS